MINANELRTGNIILIDDKHTSIVLSIDAERNVVRTKNDLNSYTDGTTGDEFWLSSSFIVGVPLSPKWLGRCGFVKLWHMNRWEFTLVLDDNLSIEVVTIQVNRTENIIVRLVTKQENDDENINIGEFITYREVPCQYVHQLQNLYYALTGEELTIKESA